MHHALPLKRPTALNYMPRVQSLCSNLYGTNKKKYLANECMSQDIHLKANTSHTSPRQVRDYIFYKWIFNDIYKKKRNETKLFLFFHFRLLRRTTPCKCLCATLGIWCDMPYRNLIFFSLSSEVNCNLCKQFAVARLASHNDSRSEYTNVSFLDPEESHSDICGKIVIFFLTSIKLWPRASKRTAHVTDTGWTSKSMVCDKWTGWKDPEHAFVRKNIFNSTIKVIAMSSSSSSSQSWLRLPKDGRTFESNDNHVCVSSVAEMKVHLPPSVQRLTESLWAHRRRIYYNFHINYHTQSYGMCRVRCVSVWNIFVIFGRASHVNSEP